MRIVTLGTGLVILGLVLLGLACPGFWNPRPGYKPVAACPGDVRTGAEVDCDAVNDDQNECYSCEKATVCYDRDRYCAKDAFCTECAPRPHDFSHKRPVDAGVSK